MSVILLLRWSRMGNVEFLRQVNADHTTAQIFHSIMTNVKSIYTNKFVFPR